MDSRPEKQGASIRLLPPLSLEEAKEKRNKTQTNRPRERELDNPQKPRPQTRDFGCRREGASQRFPFPTKQTKKKKIQINHLKRGSTVT